MSKREELKTTKGLVKNILENNVKARNSDSYLYFQVLKVIADRENIALENITVPAFLLGLSSSPFPCFESVRRSRQTLQRENPHLAACKEVSEARAENEIDFRAFAKGSA